MNFRLVWMGPDDNSGQPALYPGQLHRSARYEKRGKEIIRRQYLENGRPRLTPIANFCARIVRDLVLDDGLEQTREFGMEAEMANGKVSFSLSPAEFNRMNWVLRQLGPKAIIYPGQQQHARAAIQSLSGQIQQERSFHHLGWAQQDGKWTYLCNSGGIGGQGLQPDIPVRLPAALNHYRVEPPANAQERVKAIRASLRFLSVAPDRISFPLFAALHLAALGGTDFSLFLCGQTGTFKTSLAAVCQQHFGPEMDAHHLPGNFFSTANALEEIAFAAKDALLVIDDFVPTGRTTDGALQQLAERVFRAAGNRQGRNRMGGGARLRSSRPPRALVLATGEDVPAGQSLRARLLIVEIRGGDVDRTVLEECQSGGQQGLLAAAMGAFVQWLAGQYEQLRREHKTRVDELRNRYRAAAHARLPGALAQLEGGFEVWLRFAFEMGAISAAEQFGLRQRGADAFDEVLAGQTPYHVSCDPALRLIALLRTAIASGGAYVTDRSGQTPESPAAWGWRPKRSGKSWIPQGVHVGWLAGSDLFLKPDMSYQAAQQMAGRERLPVSEQALRHRLHGRGLLASVDAGRKMLQVRRTLEGRPRLVLHFKANLFGGSAEST